MIARWTRNHAGRRKSFTLVELMITISIVAIMASMLLFALYSVQEQAKVAKTKALIARLDAIIKNKWDLYRTRRVPVQIAAGTNQATAAAIRLTALRDLMRMEMPDRWTDITDPPVTLPFGAGSVARPAVNQAYLRKWSAANAANSNYPTGEFAGAECLYLIVMSALAEEGDSREVFKPDDVKDTDGDGFPEFVDAWGQPIKFLRWAPGFAESELQITLRAPQGDKNGIVASYNLDDLGASIANGAIIGYQGSNSAKPFDPANTAHIATCVINGQFATITVAPANALPSYRGPVAVGAPDPNDPLGVMSAASASNSGAPFALYPLIYSSGPDKCYGIMADFNGSTTMPFKYFQTTSALSSTYFGPGASAPINPFWFDQDQVTGQLSYIGTARDDVNEPNYVPSAWRDNIHNHLIGAR